MKTRHKLILIILLSLISGAILAQRTADTAKINFIKTQFAEINQNLKSYKKIEKTDTAETTEGNEVLLYYKGNEIKKIGATYYGESGKGLEEYYFFNNKVIFSYCVNYRYNMPIYEKGGAKIKLTTEQRIYLQDGKVFLIKKKPAVFKRINEFPDNPQKEAKRLLSLK